MVIPPWAQNFMQLLPSILSGVGGTAFVGWALFRKIARRVSRDTLEEVKDRTEGDLVGHLMDHNKSLMEQFRVVTLECDRLSKERAEVLARIGKFESDNEHALADLAAAQKEIALLRRKLGALLKQ